VSEEKEPLQPLSASQMEALEEAISAYQTQITPQAAQYMAARGIDRDTAIANRLGVVGNPLAGHSRFRGMLAIPFLDKDGKPLTVRFRCMVEHEHRDFYHGKYNSITGDPTRVYGIASIFEAGDEIHITEGELDSVILRKIGLHAVAIPGAKAWKGHHRRMLAGFSRIYVWGDDDDAGAEFVTKVCASMRQARGVSIRGGDVSDIYKSGGAAALMGLLPQQVAA